ncbi:MAG TPA: adenylosuccinate synthase [Thermoanaerobaculales bacterium]|nr:adenylosuccinate synthase [Thermoanaerobaculales bacterium]HPA82314.1 adenylosuccinate synthase [Thermoanaerobaculales bacterium]HQL30554.1 adenylosuccinate synthase [Thermoanaerobaculales bacterium]HQP43599.1 adenylosuccinate synthase [Thermoanaerobaculales bacterium]
MDPERSLTIVGGQWGDEGKGKVVDLLSAKYPVVVRFNGGHNAGHTVRFADRRFALHLVPSGVVHSDVTCYLAAGMVIDPPFLVAEIDRLHAQGIATAGRIFLSPRASLILPTHQAIDAAREQARGAARIGTTGRGIGPAYQDQAQRRGLRAYLLADRERLAVEARSLMAEHNRELASLAGAAAVDVDAAVATLVKAAKRLAPLLKEVGPELRHHAAAGRPILFEGAQGVLLDRWWGTYPYVTSSSCLPGMAAASCGISPSLLGPVVGVMKAYVTRVGSGPFPTELEDAVGDGLRERGAEFGTTTGRPRRCGWFDAVAARFAVLAAGIDAIALTKLDVLDSLDVIKVAVAYELPDGTHLDTVPADPELLAAVRPRYEERRGWQAETAGLTHATELPPAARDYLRYLERQVGVPIVLVSTGPRREETMVRGDHPIARQFAEVMGAGAARST